MRKVFLTLVLSLIGVFVYAQSATYNITLASATNGSISSNKTTAQAGETVTLTATPNTDCLFLAWYVFKTGDANTSVSTLGNKFKMPDYDVTISAYFATTTNNTVSVGSGNNISQYMPIFTSRNYSISQQIYMADEVGSEGYITAIAYNVPTAYSVTRNIDIYIRNTKKTNFTSSSDWETMDPSYKVFSGYMTFAAASWTTIVFNTPFKHDGSGNVNICIVDKTGSVGSNAQFLVYSTESNRRSLYASSDSPVFNDLNASSIPAAVEVISPFANNQIKFIKANLHNTKSLVVSPNNIDGFSYSVGEGPSNPQKIDIVVADIPDDIMIAASENFEISTTVNGTYSANLTIPYEYDKSRTVTSWNFEGDFLEWTTNNLDGDGHNWMVCDSEGHSSTKSLMSESSYNNAALTPDNWLISPQVTLGGRLVMWSKAQNQAFSQEHFGVYVSTTGTNPSDFTMLLEKTTSQSSKWQKSQIDLSFYAGETGYIAIRHFNCSGESALLVDDFTLDTESSYTTTKPINLTKATVYARMKSNLAIGDYNGSLQVSSGNYARTVSLSGTVANESGVVPTYGPEYPWSLSSSDYSGNGMALTAQIKLSNTLVGSGNYEVGAFCGNECRGDITSLTNWTDQNLGYFVDMNIMGNNNDVIGFYLFDAATEKVCGICDTKVVLTNDTYQGQNVMSNQSRVVLNFIPAPFFTKDIEAYTEHGGWYLIASPLNTSVSPDNVTNMTDNDFDLYRFNQSASLEWENYKNASHTEGFGLEQTKGYLYANSNKTTLIFSGTPYSGSNSVTLTKAGGNPAPRMAGWNLIGNPFNAEKTIVLNDGNNTAKSYYRMNSTGSEIIAGTGNVGPMEGVFVNAATDGEVVRFNNASKREEDMVILNLSSNDDNVIDRIIVGFDDRSELPKYTIHENSTIIYIPQTDKDYAVVKGSDTDMYPVNFKADNFGTFTLSADIAGADVNYMHLIDKLTGEDVDMLRDGKYTFIGAPVDRQDRFVLRLSYSGNFDNEVSSFAYQNGGDIVVCGEGTLQIFDLLGRFVNSQEIQGVQTIQALSAGVYIFRMVGEDVRSQKIVVR
jgi:hypothetical protein